VGNFSYSYNFWLEGNTMSSVRHWWGDKHRTVNHLATVRDGPTRTLMQYCCIILIVLGLFRLHQHQCRHHVKRLGDIELEIFLSLKQVSEA